jgi:regulator of protease activity HflC (stomatin/prohibitin superfamily)
MRSASGIRELPSISLLLYRSTVEVCKSAIIKEEIKEEYMDFWMWTLVVVVALFILSGLKVINQYQRGVVLTLGKFTGLRQPGLRIVVPIFQQLIRVDVRSTPIDVPKQEIITRDNVTAGVDAVVYFRVLDAPKAVLETTNYVYATSQFAQAALRDVTGNFELDELLSKREEISDKIKEIVDAQTSQWGIDVENVKIQNIELPTDMKRAMAKQAEAERERRSNIINAEGEKAAAQTLAEAAQIISSTPGALNLRTLNTIERISTEPSQKTTMLFPIELIDAVRNIGTGLNKK